MGERSCFAPFFLALLACCYNCCSSTALESFCNSIFCPQMACVWFWFLLVVCFVHGAPNNACMRQSKHRHCVGRRYYYWKRGAIFTNIESCSRAWRTYRQYEEKWFIRHCRVVYSYVLMYDTVCNVWPLKELPSSKLFPLLFGFVGCFFCLPQDIFFAAALRPWALALKA